MALSTSALLLLLTCQSGNSMEGRTQTTFVVDTPFSDVVHRMDTMVSLRRALKSQGIDLLTYEQTKRKLDLWTQAVNAEANIESRAPRISPRIGHIRQVTKLGLTRATIDFTLKAPLGLLAEQHYELEFEAQEKQTQISIQMYTKVNLPSRRLRSVRRLIKRIARRRISKELCQNRANLKWEITDIVTNERPENAQSMLFP